MSIANQNLHRSLHRRVFDHYLRTGERLTNAEWLARHECKFNPYHDEIGRFTSPPGVTVNWGNRRPGATAPAPQSQRTPARNGPAVSEGNRDTASPATVKPATQARAPNSVASPSAFRSEYVRNNVSSKTSHADTYFELNKRQAYLNRLRADAGANADEAVRADLDDFQRRLDGDRERLNEITRLVLDPEMVEIGRVVLPPLDTAVGAIKVFSGEGGVGDYLTVASSVPIAGAVGKVAKLVLATRAAERSAGRVVSEIIQLGGAHRDIRGLPGYHGHHTPGKAVSPLSDGEGPAVAMLEKDHMALPSSMRGKKGDLFRKAQAELIERGDFRAAIQMEIDQIRRQFGGKYDGGIEQMLRYAKDKGYIK